MLNSRRFSQHISFDNLETINQIITDAQSAQPQPEVIAPTSQNKKLLGSHLPNSQYPTLCLFTSRGDQKNINLEKRLIPPQKVVKSVT